MTRLLGLSLCLVGCADLFDTDTGSPFPIDTGGVDSDDTDLNAGCPAGLARAASGSFSTDLASFQGQALTLVLATADHAGQAPICSSKDGLKTRMLLQVGGRPTMFVSLNAEALGSQDPRGGGVTIDGFGLTPATIWSGNDIYAGTWGIEPQSGGVSHGVYFEAEEQGRTLFLRAQASFVP